MNCPHCNIPADCEGDAPGTVWWIHKIRNYRCEECGWLLATFEVEAGVVDRWRYEAKQLRKVRAAVGG